MHTSANEWIITTVQFKLYLFLTESLIENFIQLFQLFLNYDTRSNSVDNFDWIAKKTMKNDNFWFTMKRGEWARELQWKLFLWLINTICLVLIPKLIEIWYFGLLKPAKDSKQWNLIILFVRISERTLQRESDRKNMEWALAMLMSMPISCHFVPYRANEH